MPRYDISATCVTQQQCPHRNTVFRGQAAEYDTVGGGWRHAACAPCVPLPDCAVCGGPEMAHGRVAAGHRCPNNKGYYTPKEPTA